MTHTRIAKPLVFWFANALLMPGIAFIALLAPVAIGGLLQPAPADAGSANWFGGTVWVFILFALYLGGAMVTAVYTVFLLIWQRLRGSMTLVSVAAAAVIVVAAAALFRAVTQLTTGPEMGIEAGPTVTLAIALVVIVAGFVLVYQLCWRLGFVEATAA